VKRSLVDKFLNKQLSKEELKEFQVEVNQQEGTFIDELEKDWETFDSHDELSEKVWLRLESLISLKKQKVTKEKEFRLQWFVRIAASVLIVASVWFALRPSQNVAEENASPALITHSNDANQPETVILKDGTKVILGAHSIISYYENFNDRYRVVHLDGEAFFETEKENVRPFIVVSQNITSISRSSEFSVSAFKDSEEISVVSSSGHIEIAQNDKLNSEHNKVAVQSCQRYSFNKSSQKYLIGKVSDCEFDEKVRSMRSEASSEVIVML